MNVGFDVSPLVQTQAGTARYVEGLGAALERLPDLELRRLSFGGSGRAAALARDLLWYLALLPLRTGLDVLHCTTYRAPLRSRTPVVVTVHDLAVLRYPELFPAWTRLYGGAWLRPTLRAATRVIAVSEFTKREVVALAGVPEDRVRVVPNATDAAVFTADGPSADGDYVLALGTLEPRKNLPRLAQATRRLGLELRLVGAAGWGQVDLDGSGVRWLGRLPDDEVAALYRGALCFAYPSLYEGFGIPVLEAMRCGAPVVTSAGSAMEEVAGGAAELVDPLDPDAIADGIRRAIDRRAELRAAGLERARLFSWDEAARATAGVYREAAG
ncbi:MAG TPA: glycosyltransferase family 1 protein [Gaiellaceae bacterium]|nr:glycosyltransferase family 1 protein [Gaiellaceae bacterium]